MSWLGFWIFMAALVVADGRLFAQGYDTILYSHKTPEEKEIQRIKIDVLKLNKEVSE